jgi:hypothetical protein
MKCTECGCVEEVHSEDQAALMPCSGCRNCSGYKSRLPRQAGEETVTGSFEVAVKVDFHNQTGAGGISAGCAGRQITCRSSYDSFHVEYVTEEVMEEREVGNTTHQKVTPSVDEYSEEGKSEIGWVLCPDEDSHQLRLDIYRDCEDEILAQYLEPETCLQIADMFRSAAETALDMKKRAISQDQKSDQPLPATAAVQADLFGNNQ